MLSNRRRFSYRAAMDHIIYTCLIGLAAGFLAGQFSKGRGFGLLGNLLLGLIGAVVGGLVFGLLGFQATYLLGRLISATVGALLLIYVVGMVKK